MDIPDDAAGRVAIFTVDAIPDDRQPDPVAPRSVGRFHAALDRLSGWLDGPYAGLAIAAALAVVLAAGLLLLRR